MLTQEYKRIYVPGFLADVIPAPKRCSLVAGQGGVLKVYGVIEQIQILCLAFGPFMPLLLMVLIDFPLVGMDQRIPQLIEAFDHGNDLFGISVGVESSRFHGFLPRAFLWFSPAAFM